jgi:hypothetical protein
VTTCPCAGLPESVRLHLWRAPLWDKDSYKTNFLEFKRSRGLPLSPVEVPQPAREAWAGKSDLSVDIPGITEWRAALALAVEEGFPEARDDGLPVSEPDGTLREEKGWVFEQLQDAVEGGEAAYLQMLQAYMHGDASVVEPEWQPLCAEMLRVAAQLESIPGNQSGAAEAAPSVGSQWSAVASKHWCPWLLPKQLRANVAGRILAVSTAVSF